MKPKCFTEVLFIFAKVIIHDFHTVHVLPDTQLNRGLAYGIAAYVIWGFLPIYWKAVEVVPAIQILCHRMVWSLLFVSAVLLFKGQWKWFGLLKNNRKIWFTFITSSALLSVNWGIFIWGVNNHHILEASLGYFINPIVMVLLGVLILKERLRLWQWISVALAFAGVLYLTTQLGRPPWIALILAVTFSSYGLLRKTAQLGSLEGLSLETAIQFLPALGFLIYSESQGTGALGHLPFEQNLLLILAGAATAIPLLFFAASARLIPYSTLGILLYIGPTLMFLLGIFVYHEPFSQARFYGFLFIWIALIIYTIEGNVYARKKQPNHNSSTG